MPAGKATIDYDGYELLVSFEPFRPDIVDEIKRAIPKGFRTWDAQDKCWRIAKLYAAEIEEVFEVFEYAVRDYTGDDPAAKLRQAGLRAEREARIERLKQEAEELLRKLGKEEQQARGREGPRTPNEARQAEGEEPIRNGTFRNDQGEEFIRREQRNFRQEYEGDWGNWEGREANEFNVLKASLRREFFEKNPHLSERDFSFWWSFYTVGGRDYANQRYAEARGFFRRRRRFTEEDFQRSIKKTQKTLDHYKVLGIMKTCTFEEARDAFLELARKHHPNSTYAGAEPDEEKMKAVNASWDAIKEEREWA